MNISSEELQADGLWRGGTVYSDAATTLRVQIDRDVHGFVVYIMIVNHEFMKAGKTKSPFSTRMRSTFNSLKNKMGDRAAHPRYQEKTFKEHAQATILANQEMKRLKRDDSRREADDEFGDGSGSRSRRLVHWSGTLNMASADERPMDTQVIELLGRNRLVSELLRAGLEVAVPARDRGIDLIAYLDLVNLSGTKDSASAVVRPGQRFVARPIQMKAASRQSFSISRKYARLRDLILAFVWNLEDPDRAVTYALTYEEAVSIGESLGWTATSSWTDRHSYDTTRPSAKLIERLEGFRRTPSKWRAKVSGVQQLPGS